MREGEEDGIEQVRKPIIGALEAYQDQPSLHNLIIIILKTADPHKYLKRKYGILSVLAEANENIIG